jgi:Ca2+-binding RTX toxin-like protein
MNGRMHSGGPAGALTRAVADKWRARRRLRGKASAKRGVALVAAVAILASGFPSSSGISSVGAAPVGMGFTITPADLSYILEQIKIAEAHVQNTTPETGPCGALLGSGPNQISSPLLPFGLRTVSGICNNIEPGQETFGAVDQTFPRLTSPSFRPAENTHPSFGPPNPTSYAQTGGFVFDTQPRLISNLIVDQTSNNPAAREAAGFPVRTQGNEGVFQCDDPNKPAEIQPPDCIEDPFETLFIPNVTTDIGLSPPFNGLFTIFGQFFDHGLDKIVNGGSGTVFVPLRADDPLIAGPDHDFGTSDDLPPDLRFMVLTRGKKVNAAGDAINVDTSFVDQSQTYSSHPSHQVFLREYAFDATADRLASTGKLLASMDGGLPNWTQIKDQAANVLGLQLQDKDVFSVPMLATDAYGNFIPGPDRGLPQYVTTTGLVEGDTITGPDDTTGPVPVPANVVKVGLPFLFDIAHYAAPNSGLIPDGPVGPGPDGVLGDNPLTLNADEGADDVAVVNAFGGAEHPVVGDDPLTLDFDESLDDELNFGGAEHPLIGNLGDSDIDESLDDTPAIPANGGAEHPFVGDDPLTLDFDESLDDTPEVPANGGAEHPQLGNLGTSDMDESLDDVLGTVGGPGPDLILGDNPLTTNADEGADDAPFFGNDGVGDPLTPTAPGTYDDELLGLHFIAGDGRLNENIALTAVHQIFHSEHDRLVAEFDTMIQNDPSLADYMNTGPTTFTYGERLFQAARFVTEMEYQHLVFEEFARKVQPGINPFEAFAFGSTDINPAITAEFAHAVYRFGHSMLTEDIDRIHPATGQPYNIPLLDGFLNPAEYNNSPFGLLSSQQAAGGIIMGMSDQVGNEIDEFVTSTLQSNLLGLPLDLAAINITRGRSEGVATLNNFRKQVFAATNASEMAPYMNWVDFGLGLKHPASLVNFVAAYGTHPTITAQSTIDGKREAARRIVNPTQADFDASLVPADFMDFMYSTALDTPTSWSNAGTNSITGVDAIDLWMGGLAEVTNPFGGLLGSTFNYVFEKQMTDLQNGDRFYYIARTLGMNLFSQLEGNSFAELMMRNSTAHTLKADAFATADCKFQMGNNPGVGNLAPPFNRGYVQEDPDSECLENSLLTRNQPGNQVRYLPRNGVDPSGINGQSVYNGTEDVDNIWGGNDNDTFLGNGGNDRLEGGAGDDVAIGGEGNDIITDTSGDDVPKGGPGNDAIDAGIGLDIVMGGEGHDFTNGGANANETFLGNGNDFAIGGEGADGVFGDAGDDWLQGGEMIDLLIGESATFFFDDHNLPGHDVFIGQGGDDDYDGEGGDDIMVAGPGVEKNAGAAGFDWVVGVGDAAMDLDLTRRLLPNPLPQIEVMDRFDEIEGASGWNHNDILRGDIFAPFEKAGAGFVGCNALDADGRARISGLATIIPTLPRDSADIIANGQTRYCMLDVDVWAEGDILLGGLGSDLFEGREADDVIDGDRWMNVRLSVNGGAGSTDLMEHQALTGTFGVGTAGMTLQQAVFAGLVDPGNISIVREIVTPVAPAADCGAAAPVNCDTAVFSGVRANYTINTVLGVTTITDNVGADGTDTLRNVERAQFLDGTFGLGAPSAPTNVTALAGPGSGQVTVNFTPPAGALLNPINGFTILVRTAAAPNTIVRTITTVPANATSFVVGNGAGQNAALTNGTAYVFTVAARNAVGTGANSALSNSATPVGSPPLSATPVAPTAGATNFPLDQSITLTFSRVIVGLPATPAAPTGVSAVAGPASGQVRVNFTPTGNALSPTTSFRIVATVLGAPALPARTINFAGDGTTRSFVVGSGTGQNAPLTNNRLWSFTVRALNPGLGALSGPATATPVAAPGPSTAPLPGPNVDQVEVRNTATNAVVPVVVSLTGNTNAGARLLTIDPSADLLPNTNYTVRLLAGSCAGPGAGFRTGANLPTPCQALPLTQWTFTTTANLPPTVTATNPAGGANGVARLPTITATFSEAVQGVSTATVTLVRVGTGEARVITVTMNGANTQATIIPDANLRRGTTYRVTLTGGPTAIRDNEGAPLATTSWVFTTAP